MRSFVYTALPSRVVFGVGSVDRLPAEVETIGARRALVLATPRQRVQAEDLVGQLGDRVAGIFDQITMHVPVEALRTAIAVAKHLGTDACVAIGGGSTIG